MTRPSNISRLKVGLMLSLVGLMAGFMEPGFCQSRLPLAANETALLSSTRWVLTGNLNIARYGHTATLLPNGKVLVAGGRVNNSNILDSAELYDPTTGTWSVTGRLNASHIRHTATLLRDGRVLVVGGVNIQSINDVAELYDPGTGTWTRTVAPATNRLDHTATLLQTGKVLVAGGVGAGFVRIAELYDPATGTWSSTGSLITGRALHQATRLQDGRVLVTGGANDADESTPVASTEIYDPLAGTWSNASDLNTARYSHTATLLPNGKVLVAAGNGPPLTPPYTTSTNTAELFDPATGHWSNSGSLNSLLFYRTATLLCSGKVLVAGGDTFDYGVVPERAELYDASRGVWNSTSDLNTARSGHTATLLPNGKVLVAGGLGFVGTGRTLDSAELYESAVLPGTIGPGFTGAWYDPAQSGHGLFVQVLSDNRLLAWWFTFNPTGTEQAWFGGVGTYSGNSATITAVNETTGGRWIPNFNPGQVVNNPWGTFTFTFTDVNHGKVDFSSVAGYGSGSMNLTRLTQPAGLTCP